MLLMGKILELFYILEILSFRPISATCLLPPAWMSSLPSRSQKIRFGANEREREIGKVKKTGPVDQEKVKVVQWKVKVKNHFILCKPGFGGRDKGTWSGKFAVEAQCCKSGPVAQWIRHLTTNQGIAGSSPARIKKPFGGNLKSKCSHFMKNIFAGNPVYNREDLLTWYLDFRDHIWK